MNVQEENGDVNACLYYLSTYMGHKSLLETQDYLWLAGESFEGTCRKMEEYSSFVTAIFDRKAGEMDIE